MRLTGRVLRIDRARQRAEVVLAGASGTVPVPYEDQKRPPPPLSTVLIEQTASGQWQLQSTNAKAIVFHEDFTSIVAGAGIFQADTTWGTLGTGFVLQSTAIPAYGLLQISPNPASPFASAAKDQSAFTAQEEEGLWLSASIGTSDTTGGTTTAGLTDNGANNMAYVEWNRAFGLLTAAKNGGAGSNIAMAAQTINTNQLYDLDVVLLPGRFVAGWWNGDGPYVVTTNIPSVGQGLTPFLFEESDGVATPNGYYDWVHVESFRNVTRPERIFDVFADQKA